MSQKNEKFDKQMFKKSPEELELYLQFRRRGTRVESKKGKGSFRKRGSKVNNKKGKGSYSRKQKHKNKEYRNCA